jgi:methylenetetrahydrofolate dehydrogenase (NADP+) / methenyltetrahydrofolate cyclohydrolase
MHRIIDGKNNSRCNQAGDCTESQVKLLLQEERRRILPRYLVGNNPSSESYVSNKVKDCHEVGFRSTLIRFGNDVEEHELLEKISSLNNDHETDAFIVQLPLPKHINENRIIESIDPGKRCRRIPPG